ncbi:unnamed protein product [Ilex paraguariensis]|uniref:Transmembrane protein n=1 Tax=Ilex paraguariensis TaxID=185542 RepID=A0ABC8V572_9AQUA
MDSAMEIELLQLLQVPNPDSKLSVDMVNKRIKTSWKFWILLDEISGILQNFSFQIQHSYREGFQANKKFKKKNLIWMTDWLWSLLFVMHSGFLDGRSDSKNWLNFYISSVVVSSNLLEILFFPQKAFRCLDEGGGSVSSLLILAFIFVWFLIRASMDGFCKKAGYSSSSHVSRLLGFLAWFSNAGYSSSVDFLLDTRKIINLRKRILTR